MFVLSDSVGDTDNFRKLSGESISSSTDRLKQNHIVFYLSLVWLYVSLVWQEIGGRVVEEEEQERDQPTHSSPGQDRTQEVNSWLSGE